jgi:mandelate racemase
MRSPVTYEFPELRILWKLSRGHTDMELPNLTVRSIRTTAVSVPMARPLITSIQTVRAAPLLLVDLETEQGVTGRAYLFCYIPLAAALIARVVDELLGLVKGDRLAPLEIGEKVGKHFRLIGTTGVISMALAALDMACWDALAVATGVPLAKFLGGSLKPIPAYNSNGLGLMNANACADEAEQLLEAGFRGVKLRLGYPTLEQDLEVARAVRTRLPDSVELMTDYNQALSLDEALRRGLALDHEGLAWIEEPIRHDDYAGCAKIARELSTPIQIGENFSGPRAMMDAINAKAADFMMPDLARIGGVSGWQEAASLAATNGIRISSHLFPEFSVHLLAASPTCHWLEYVDWASPILVEPLAVIDGMVTPPNRPRSGVTWNDNAVSRYSMRI